MTIFSSNDIAAPQPMVCQVTATFYSRNSDGTIRYNETTGARFWSKPTNDGNWRMLVRIDRALNVIKNGDNISSFIEGKTADLRLSPEDYELLVDQASEYEVGSGIQFVIELETAPYFSELTISQSNRGRNGQVRSIALVGEILVDEPITPAMARLNDNVDVSSLDKIKEHCALMDAQAKESLEQYRGTNAAARAGVPNQSEELV